jgi:hypothetical protein
VPYDTARIQTVTIRAQGGPGHGALPQRMPYHALYRQSFGGGNVVLVAGTGGTDTSANVGLYEAAHENSLTAINHVRDDDSVYYIRGEGEAGTNALTDLRIYACIVSISAV